MYCTILPWSTSTGLSVDALAAYHRFRAKAQTLGRVSRSFNPLAVRITDVYRDALMQPASDSWTTLITTTALLVQRARAFHETVGFDAGERDAFDFFAAIVDENADLLAPPDELVSQRDSVFARIASPDEHAPFAIDPDRLTAAMGRVDLDEAVSAFR
jgi:hypothetical protein